MKKADGITKIVCGIVIAIIMTIGSLVLWKIQINKAVGVSDNSYIQYQYYYALITDEGNESFWQGVYEGASNTGAGTGVYVERMGDNLAVEYSLEERMEIAIASGVDGIILEGTENEIQEELVQKANEAGIPVVTALNDNYGSNRISFVGVSDYDLGREYARQVIKAATTEMDSVLIFVDADSNNSGQNIFFNGFSDTLTNEGNHLQLTATMQPVNGEDVFGTQEVIRNVLVNQDDVPDIIICLNETSTVSVYQAIVDYNMVGEVTVIGYYDSPTIINAIDKGIIYSTIVVDSNRMGELCVNAMNEYLTTGYVNDYITMEVNVINEKNVGEYQTNEEVSQ